MDDQCEPVPEPANRRRLGRPRPVEALAAGLLLVLLLRQHMLAATGSDRVQAWLTVFVAIVFQAAPFVVLGTVISGTITAFVPPSFFARALPGRGVLAVPVAGVAGVVLPGCECGSVPVAGALARRGVPPAAALAFLLSAPAINPVVLVSTAVAFPGQPVVVVARFAASLIAAVVVGWIWLRLGAAGRFRAPAEVAPAASGRAATFLAACREDTATAGGYLVIGAMAAATLNVTVPPTWLRTVADRPVLSILAMGLLAVVLSICSEADAFVAAALTQFSLTARLVFLVVGPMVDLKLVAMQAGAFGRGFAVRFGPATFVVAVASAVGVGTVLW